MVTTMSEEIQRFTASNPCPICGGHKDMARGHGERCFGYLFPDGNAVCTREEHSHDSSVIMEMSDSNGWLHRLNDSAQVNPTKQHTSNREKPKTKIVETYGYHNATGKMIFQACRLHYLDESGKPIVDTETGKPRKTFYQRQPNGRGGWIDNLQGVDLVLYCLPKLLKADPNESVFITEGEKHTDRLRSLGFVSTTSPMGAGKWRDSYSETLRGRHVVILPDNDDEGQKHAVKVARSLTGIAVSIRVLNLPRLPSKGDIINWLDDTGGTADELRRLVKECPIWTPSVDTKQEHKSKSICLADIKEESISWLWFGRFALKKISLLVGNPGLGKSFLTIDLAARVSTGVTMLDGSSGCLGSVLTLNAEDDLSDTVKPRLRAAGADCRRIHALSFADVSNLINDIGKIEDTIKELKDCRLLVIDPITAFMGRIDSHKNAEVRQLLAVLADLAAKHRLAVVIVSHLNKSISQEKAINRISGSLGFVAAARAA